MSKLRTIAFFTLACTACADVPPVREESAELRGQAPQLIQPGSQLTLHGVTTDDHGIYQDGQTLYATRLRPGAARTVISVSPGNNIPQILQVGGVVFSWPDPQRNLPGFGVSPLYMWSADTGTVLISKSSAVGLVATSSSDDDEQIVFTTNVTPDGLRGDLATARTRRAASPTILLADIPLDFPSGRCRPLAGFAGEDGDIPIAAYCAPGEQTATMSIWVHGRKRDLVNGIFTPMPFRFESDPALTTFLVNRADGTVVKVKLDGEVTVVDQVLSRQGFLNARGTAGYLTQPVTGGTTELRLADRSGAPRVAVPTIARLYVGLYNRAGFSRRTTTSPDGNWILFGTTLDPSTGNTDMSLLDLRTRKVFTVDATVDAQVNTAEVFTADSSNAIFWKIDFNQGTATIFAANARDGARQLSDDGSAFDYIAGDGSTVIYADNPVFDPGRAFFLSRADLKVVDARHPERGSRLVSAGAYYQAFANHGREKMTFTSEVEKDGPGLYVAGTRL